ncbi:PEP-CTERM sorting domain-containing protein [Gemmatimonas sp.]|uniref:PEP-CTERM sorting domain-containing protein n=1 Tax=Gemmatimonas sp. TaxID=1962908 RepID=UPI0035613BB0
MQWSGLVVACTAALLCLSPAPVSAQSIPCAMGSSLCAGYEITDYTTTGLSLRVWNASPSNQQARIESIALWNVGGISGALHNWSASSDVTVANAGAGWIDGTPSGWISGPVSAPSLSAKTRTNGGIVGQDGSAGGGTTWQTANADVNDPTAYLTFRFTYTGAPAQLANNVLFGFRAKSLAPSVDAATSYKCDPTSTNCALVECAGTNCARYTAIVPEPQTIALMAAGLVGLFAVARRRHS